MILPLEAFLLTQWLVSEDTSVNHPRDRPTSLLPWLFYLKYAVIFGWVKTYCYSLPDLGRTSVNPSDFAVNTRVPEWIDSPLWFVWTYSTSFHPLFNHLFFPLKKKVIHVGIWHFRTPFVNFSNGFQPHRRLHGMGARSQPRRAMEQCEVEESKLQDIRRVVDYLGKLTE